MSQKPKIDNVELIMRAYDEVVPREIIEIPLADGQVMKAKMEAPDIFAINKETKMIKAAELNSIRTTKPELFNEPYNQTDWQKEVDKAVKALKPEKFDDDKKYADAVNDAKNQTPPANAAEQIAEEQARMEMIVSIIPKYLRDVETDDLLFPTPKGREWIARYIKANMKLFKQVSEAFVRLFSEMDLTDEAKNSSDGENSTNTSSSNTSPDDTDTGAHLTLT